VGDDQARDGIASPHRVGPGTDGSTAGFDSMHIALMVDPGNDDGSPGAAEYTNGGGLFCLPRYQWT
jgi:hypothetical protein